MEDLERIKERLDNVRSVEPILTALRTIAAGSWRLARSRLEAARLFAEELSFIFRALQQQGLLPPSSPVASPPEKTTPSRKVGILIIASERGLCGAFNTLLLQAAERYLAEQRQLGHEIELITLGTRATTYFRRQGMSPMWSESLPVMSVASLTFVQYLYKRLLSAYNSGHFDSLYVVYTPYQMRLITKPVMRLILPSEIRIAPQEATLWPPPIIDVDPQALYSRLLDQWTLAQLYQFVMESAASEQSARFRVLDGASSNAQRLIEELTQSYHTARQHAITMEMLDLISGAGLLKSSGRRSPQNST